MEYLTELLADYETQYTREDVLKAVAVLQELSEYLEACQSDMYTDDLECQTPFSELVKDIAEIINRLDGE